MQLPVALNRKNPVIVIAKVAAALFMAPDTTVAVATFDAI
jgi:hypothetical protein